MALDSKHPQYSDFISDWQTMRDCYRGERVVKSRGVIYLPATESMVLAGMTGGQQGYREYRAYIQRAVFHDFVTDAVQAMIGLMHQKPPTIELPKKLESLVEDATADGESLEQLLRKINEQQLITGRYGLLLDTKEKALVPYIAPYVAEHINNWDDEKFVILDESDYKVNAEYNWEFVSKYRLLQFQDGVYTVGVSKDNSTEIVETIEPSISGRKLDEIPFVFINSKDTVASPDDPPLIGLAKLALAVYRGEADYRQNLFLQGQDILVVTGQSDEGNVKVGAGAVLSLPQGDAKYIGVTSEGLPEQRLALENDKILAAYKAGQAMNTQSSERESGDALRIRIAAQTATLNQVALTGAAGLEQILKIAARWVGANEDEVIVTPNLDFVDDTMTGKALIELMTANSMGAPLSKQSIHKLAQDKGLTELTFDEEMTTIEGEEIVGTGTDAGGDEEDEDVS